MAAAVVAAIGNARQFKTGRELSAWPGLVPRQHSSGQRTVLLGISKRSDRYLRTLLIHGARAAARVAERERDGRSIWLSRLKPRGGPKVAAVALANKNARVLWALLAGNDTYRPAAVPGGQAASGARLSPTEQRWLRAPRLIPASAASAPGMK